MSIQICWNFKTQQISILLEMQHNPLKIKFLSRCRYIWQQFCQNRAWNRASFHQNRNAKNRAQCCQCRQPLNPQHLFWTLSSMNVVKRDMEIKKTPWIFMFNNMLGLLYFGIHDNNFRSSRMFCISAITCWIRLLHLLLWCCVLLRIWVVWQSKQTVLKLGAGTSVDREDYVACTKGKLLNQIKSEKKIKQKGKFCLL